MSNLGVPQSHWDLRWDSGAPSVNGSPKKSGELRPLSKLGYSKIVNTFYNLQIEKGPVDYITGNARYALHEKNLLSKITDFHKLNVMVYLEDDPYLNDTAHTPLKSCQVIL